MTVESAGVNSARVNSTDGVNLATGKLAVVNSNGMVNSADTSSLDRVKLIDVKSINMVKPSNIY